MPKFSTHMEEYIHYCSYGDLKTLLTEGQWNDAIQRELPFHYLASVTTHKNTELFTSIIELLLDFKFDINALDEYGKTPLHVAVLEHKNLHVAVPLMKNGGDFKGVSLAQEKEIQELGLTLATPMFLRRHLPTEQVEMRRGGLFRILEIREYWPWNARSPDKIQATFYEEVPQAAPSFQKLEKVSWKKLKEWTNPYADQKLSPFWFVLENTTSGEIIEANHFFSRDEGFGSQGILKVGDKIYKHWEHHKIC